MAIEVRCPCGKLLRVDDALGAREGICPACGNLLEVPGGAEGICEVGRTAVSDARGLTTAPAATSHAGLTVVSDRKEPSPSDVMRPSYRLIFPIEVLAGAFLFGPVAGVILLAWNYLLVRRLRAFVLTIFVGLVLTAAAAAAMYAMESRRDPSLVIILPIVVGTWVGLPVTARLLQRRMYADYRARGGERGPLWRLVGLGICGGVLWLVVSFAVLLAWSLVPVLWPAEKSMQASAGETIVYPRELPNDEASRLCDTLKEFGLFNGVGRQTVRLTRRGDGRRVWLALRSGHNDPAVVARFEELHRRIVQEVFPDRPVELVLCDEYWVIKQTFR
jgi:hypothetical protein